MPLVEIQGYLYEFSRTGIPANLQPRLYFRPRKSLIVGQQQMEVNREVFAELRTDSYAEGYFEVELEGDCWYTPVVDWLSDPAQAGEDAENRARGFAEFPAIFSGEGGLIGNLPRDPIQIGGVWYGFGDPPDYLSGALYMDISGRKAVLWAPKGRQVHG